MTTSAHRVRLGSLILSDGGNPYPSGNQGYQFEVLGEDFSTGDALPVESVVRSLLQDGSIVSHDRDDNREPGLTVVISAATTAGLSDGAAALLAQLYKRNEFGWTPPDSYSVETVYDVVTSSVERVPDDLAEVMRLERTYRLRLVCQPFGRPNSQNVAAAIAPTPATPTTATIDNASTSTANWAASSPALLSSQSTFLRASSGADLTVTYTPTSAVPLAVTNYVSLRMWATIGFGGGTPITSPFRLPPQLYVNGTLAPLVATAPEGGFTRYYFQSPATSGMSFKFVGHVQTSNGQLNFTALQRTDTLPTIGTARESQRSVAVGGTARTQGSFVISHATSSLGLTMLYTYAGQGASPALRQYRSSGGAVTVDTTTVSGAREPMNSGVYFDVPVAQIMRGTHQVWLYARRTTVGTATLSLNAQVFVGGVAVAPALPTTSLVYAFADTNYHAIALGNLPLPSVDLPTNSTAVVRIGVGSGADAAVQLDEAWAFNRDVGDLTVLDAGTNKRVTLNTPTIDRPYPSIFVGNATDGSDSFNANGTVQAWGEHEFVPPLVSALVVTAGALSAAATFSYYRRTHYELGAS